MRNSRPSFKLSNTCTTVVADQIRTNTRVTPVRIPCKVFTLLKYSLVAHVQYWLTERELVATHVFVDEFVARCYLVINSSFGQKGISPKATCTCTVDHCTVASFAHSSGGTHVHGPNTHQVHDVYTMQASG